MKMLQANHFTVSATDPEGDTVAYTETGATIYLVQDFL